MAWTNVFDLTDWDVYIQYQGITESPTPDSVNMLVRAEDLDPAVGTVTVEDGVVVCSLESESGSGGIQPMIVLVPTGAPVGTAPARVTCTRNGVALVTATTDCAAFSIASVELDGDQTYLYEFGTVFDALAQGVEVTELAYSAQIPSGEGLAFFNDRPGF